MAFPKELQKQFIQMLNQNKIQHTSGWSNFMETVNNPAAMVIEVTNEKQVALIMKTIKELNQKQTPESKITVRATAGWADNDKQPNCLCFFGGWQEEQEERYNEGFSFSQVVGGRASEGTPGTDVVIRFAKSYHHAKVGKQMKNPPLNNPKNPIQQLPVTLVEVSAGMQISEISDFLREHKLSLSTASMIAWVTGVGLAGTAGHGTGRDEGAFSGLIESITICDLDGNIRTLTSKDPDFADLIGGHSGLLGIVLKMEIRAVKAFNLKETIRLFSDAKEMSGKLGDILKNNQYISMMGMPSYTSSDLGKVVPQWQIREWNYTTDHPNTGDNAPYAPDLSSLAQDIQIKIGSSVMDHLLDSGLKHLMPAFMALSAAVVASTRGTSPKVDYENHITHPQVAFPKEMRDVSYLIPVKDAEAGQVLEDVLSKMESTLLQAAKDGEYPVTYAIYVRYIKGTNGGLSTSATSSDDERVLAIDVVTHPDAPGIENFEKNMMSYFKSKGITPRNHLGKNFPSGVVCYEQFLGHDAVQKYMDALVRWHNTPNQNDGKDKLEMSPFLTPFLQKMLSPAPVLKEELEEKSKGFLHVKAPSQNLKATKHSEAAQMDFLTKLRDVISKLEISSKEGTAAKEIFLSACAEELEKHDMFMKSI